MSSNIWIPIKKSYENEKLLITKTKQLNVINHPLVIQNKNKILLNNKENNITNNNNNINKKSLLQSVSFDPLSSNINNTIVDPLLDPLSSMNLNNNNNNNNIKENNNNNITNININTTNNNNLNTNTNTNVLVSQWEIKKSQIKNDYKVVGNIMISSSAVKEFAGSGVEDGNSKKHVDIYANRLANLEKKQLNDDIIEMSQKECESHLNKLFKDLEVAWSHDERVQSLKIAIQLAKLLVDTTVPQFYPSMFVMVTDNLDKFGDMVYNRLKSKTEEIFNEKNIMNASTEYVTIQKKKVIRLTNDFKSNDIPTEAKETCRNWFYKIACIRELLPRIYIEISLLKCYRFLTDLEFQQILLRISSLIRGLGNPIVSIYCRLYLVVVGNEVAPEVTAHLPGLIQDILFSCQMLQESTHLDNLKKYKLTEADYSHLLSPAIEFLLKIIATKNSNKKELFQSLLQSYRDYSLDLMILRHFIETFDGSCYAHGVLGMAALIKTARITSILPTDAFAALAKQLIDYPPPEEQKIPLLNEVWKVVSKTDDISSYIRCCNVWIDVVQKHYSDRELLILMTDCSNKLTTFKANGGEIPENVSSYLEGLVTSLMTGFGSIKSNNNNMNNINNMNKNEEMTINIDAIFTSEHFLKILDVFKGPRKVAICKDILHTFKKHNNTNDAILINFLFDIGRTLHDSIDVLSADGEKRHISSLLCSFIDKIDYGRDLEQQLNQYVECRAIFCNLDMVKDKLINCVCNLAMKCYYVMHGTHSKRTSSFVKACLAYCHITIPSINDTYRKLQLLLYCSEIALQNQCLPQTDTFLKSAISLIPEMNTTEEIDGKVIHTEDKLFNIIRQLLSLLVLVPGHPEYGPFYMVKGLYNALNKYQWQVHTGINIKVYIEMIALLNVYAQLKFPYHLLHVESNDHLYGSNNGYMEELNEVITQCIDEIIKLLTNITLEKNDNNIKAIQTKLILELNCQLLNNMELTTESVVYMSKLLELVNRNKTSLTTKQDLKYMQLCLDFIHNKVKNSNHGTSLLHIIKNIQK